MQIVGKVRMASMPHQNHWWHVTLYVSPRGLTTGPMPRGKRTFEIAFDFIDHALIICDSEGTQTRFGLGEHSVAGFYQALNDRLAALDLNTEIVAVPFDLQPATPFAEDHDHASYDPEYTNRFLRVLSFSDAVLREFAGRFTGKQSPSHVFWHSFDLAMARYSGRRAPDRRESDMVTREAYSHEVISFGFWAGDSKVPYPAYYSYTAPEPEGLANQALEPEQSHWNVDGGSSMALLSYDDVRQSSDPHGALLAFFESAYQAGAKAAGWDREQLATVRFTG